MNGIAEWILDIVTVTRRFTPGSACATTPCPRCAAVHVPRIRERVDQGLPVRFLLPAFPGKSPNPRKVLGVVPDMAEELALEFLHETCGRIRTRYAPGAEIHICSDGRVFSDVIGILDENVTEYRHVLHEMSARIGRDTLRLYHLDDAYPGLGHDAMRTALLDTYGEELETIRRHVADGGEPLALYRGVTRFLFEDSDRPDNTDSRAARQRDSRRRAYEVIRRSAAWGELLRDRFPDAVRLSIHPQACGADKIGVGLMETDDNWLSPWHGVAVDVDGRFQLMPRHQAEGLDAELVSRDGRPSHFRLRNRQSLAS